MERDKLNQISKRPTGIFYLDGNKAFYFEQTLGSPLALDIPLDTISSLELINKKKLDTLLQAFIRSYKLVPKNIVILLSTQVTFDKDFPQGSIEIEKNIQEFLELVPFEHVIDKRIIASGKTRVVVANKELCEAVKASFLFAGFLVSGVYPLSMCIEAIPQLQSNLDLNLVVNKLSELKAYNLLPVIEISVRTEEKEKPDKTRMILLVSVFFFLILILIFVLYKNVFSSPKKPVSNKLPEPRVVAQPTVTPLPVVPVEEPVINTSTTSGENNL